MVTFAIDTESRRGQGVARPAKVASATEGLSPQECKYHLSSN